MSLDPRIWEADEWQKRHRWMEAEIDRLTIESRYCLQRERELRSEVRNEREAAMLQAEADRELVSLRRPA
jgi:hypothetical protein